MSDDRPNPETLVPRAVARWLLEAEGALVKAQKATDDRATGDAIDRARKELGPARKRAELVLKDVALKTARQTDLLTQGE